MSFTYDNIVRVISKKSITNGTRHIRLLEKSELCKNSRPVKSLSKFIKFAHGRSTLHGKITSWHRHRGAKKLTKLLHTSVDGISLVLAILYDPLRSGFVSLKFNFTTGKFHYDLSTEYVTVGCITVTYRDLHFEEPHLGYKGLISCFNIGTILHSIGPLHYPKFATSAGSYVQLVELFKKKALIRLPSLRLKLVPLHFYATLGRVSNRAHKSEVIGKAGRAYHMGRKPIVRGIAMNPVDHPHGGRTNGGRPSCSPWGYPTKCKFSLSKRTKKRQLKARSKY